MSLYTLFDPALGVVNGHHLAACERYIELAERGCKVRVIANEAFEGALCDRLKKAGAEVWPILRHPIYFPPEDQQGVTATRAMLGMAMDIRKVLRASRQEKQEVTFFYPTVDWLYAKALALALSAEPVPSHNQRHLALLMAGPWETNRGRDIARGRMCYTLALRALDRHRSVKLLVASGEHAAHYRALPTEGVLLPSLCPCFLANWEEVPGEAERKHLLLFAGDPRPDKGFLSLPELVRQVLEVDAWRELSIWIQHTPIPDWDDGTLQEAARAILEMSQSDPRIRYTNGTWSEMELQKAIRNAAVVFLNYDQQAFANKTSGILWLAGFYRTPVAVPRNTWLWREATRLGCPTYDIERVFPCDFTAPSETPSVSDYRKELYRSFPDWVLHMGNDAGMPIS